MELFTVFTFFFYSNGETPLLFPIDCIASIVLKICWVISTYLIFFLSQA